MIGGIRAPGPQGRRTRWARALVCLTLGGSVSLPPAPAGAAPAGAAPAGAAPAEAARVQVLTGRAEPLGNTFYLLPDLRRGQTLLVHARATSGNLDPVAAVSRRLYDAEALVAELRTTLERRVAEGTDPLDVVPALFDAYFEAWDDDGGEGYDAALSFEIPADGTYQLLVLRYPLTENAGEYRLLVGLDSPGVLSGRAEPTGAPIAVLDEARTQVRRFAEEVSGRLGPGRPEVPLPLRPLKAGETLYAEVSAEGTGPAPVLVLEDFGGKPLERANFGGGAGGRLARTFDHDARGYRLVLRPAEGRPSTDGYVLRIGLNEAGALTGAVPYVPGSVVAHAIPVAVGVTLHQITNVNQVAERYGAVALLRMEWQDPALAFRPDECRCRFKIFTGDEFGKAVAELGAQWPQFTLLNQQGNRWTQNRNAVVWPDGRALYLERFTTDFQAPDFDFRKFPFDTQDLYIRVQSLLPDTFYRLTDLPGQSGVGTQLGEEEWYVVTDHTELSTEEGQSRYALAFEVKRHLDFYVFRILVPIGLIILVSWFTFFLRDYGKRVDVAGANLLVFVAFNFTISGELPRLGYLTFMDALLIGTFVISAFVVMFNVFLKRLELEGKREVAERIDRSSIWVYPAAYALGAAVAVVYYFV